MVQYADLASISFAGTDLRDVTFLGCRLNGASFIGANLVGTRFIGCYAAEYGDPVQFGGDRSGVELIHSHIGRGDSVDGAAPGWPTGVAAAAWQTINGDNVVRYRAVVELGASAYSPVGPFLVGLLHDPEWDVRAAAVQALTVLRDGGFPDGDAEVVRAVVEALGDENSIVSMHATDFVQAVKPSRDLLTQVISDVNSETAEQVVTGLRVVIALSRMNDPQRAVATAFDGRSLLRLLRSPVTEVRAEYLHALGTTNQNVSQAWQIGLRDERPEVRAHALSAIRLLDAPPPARIVEPLLKDPAEGVRIEALFTLGQLGGYDRALVSAALTDPSEQVQRYAAMLLETDA